MLSLLRAFCGHQQPCMHADIQSHLPDAIPEAGEAHFAVVVWCGVVGLFVTVMDGSVISLLLER
jgi:hypothetical protein